MNAEVFMDYAYLYLDSASRLTFEAKSVCWTYNSVFKAEFRLYPKDFGRKPLVPALGPGSPAFDFQGGLSCLEWHHAHSIASNRVPALGVCAPDLHLEFWPASESLCFIMEIKGVVPLTYVFWFVFNFLICFTLFFSRNQDPVISRLDAIFTEKTVSIKASGTRDFTNKMKLRGWGCLGTH